MALENSKEGLEIELRENNQKINDTCWNKKRKYDSVFPNAFNGLRQSKEKFKQKCFEEEQKGTDPHISFPDLEKLYKAAFDDNLKTYQHLDLLDMSQFEFEDEGELLSRKITGSTDTPIGKFIEYLENSDWVRAGIAFADKSGDKCPFCQQSLPNNIYQDLNSFFDDSYEKDLTRLKIFHSAYKKTVDEAYAKLSEYSKRNIPILDYSLFNSKIETFRRIAEKNIRTIESKIKSPSLAVQIESLVPIMLDLNEIIIDFDVAIDTNNMIAANKRPAQRDCLKKVWQLIVSDLSAEIENHKKKSRDIKSGLEAINNRLKDLNEKKSKLRSLVKDKEKTITSVKPTVDAINSLLSRYGFEGFSIAENSLEPGTYKIVRTDGLCVDKTLSEGEYNFVTFLYFYHLVYGAQNREDISVPKIVVIDDPVSSLDSNILFVVSTLTKKIIEDCRKNSNGIQQVFVFTHNTYFHKEITYIGSRNSWKKNEVSFWIVKKSNNISQIVDYKGENPIRSSYELLWSELKNPNDLPRVTIFNTLRRILEYYFKIIGDIDYEACLNNFHGADKIVCKSLISFVNDGSHFIVDDYMMQNDIETQERYLDIFKLIFEKLGHIAHYNMMMGITDEEEKNTEEIFSWMN